MSSQRPRVLIVILILAFGVLAVFGALGAYSAQAQENDPPLLESPLSPDTVVPGAIPVQGRLTDPSGTPLQGTYNLTFRLYEVESGGVAICSDTNSVLINNGLFNSYIDNCYNDLWGQKVWFAVQVAGDEEMIPRQVIYAVPYAMTLRPGALISGTYDGALTLMSRNTGDYDALVSYAYGGGEAVTAYTDSGVALLGYSDQSLAVQGYSFNDDAVTYNPGIYGCVAADATACDTYRAVSPAGVMGFSSIGPGVFGRANSLTTSGVLAYNSGGGAAIMATANSEDLAAHWYPTLYLAQANADGDFVVGVNSYFGTRYWRVDREGRGYFNGGTHNTGADFAEQMQTQGDAATFEPGDVLVIGNQGDALAALSSQPFDTAVLGVYSTEPGVLLGAPDTDEALGGIPVAMLGVVPCKVTAENGPIQRGDLLVTSSVPGTAMRAGDDPPQGTVLGKALQPLTSGEGVILVLVTLQ